MILKLTFLPGKHIVNFAVAQYDDGTEFVFKGYNALHEFCDFVFSLRLLKEKSTEMDLMEYDDTIDDEMMETDDDDDDEPMQIDNTDIDLMEMDHESDIDFESECNSDVKFLNNDESEEELSFYRRFENTF